MVINLMPGFIKRIQEWLDLADYDAAKDQGTKDIIKRFARGNVTFQNGGFLDDDDVRDLAKKGDAAAGRMAKRRVRANDQQRWRA